MGFDVLVVLFNYVGIFGTMEVWPSSIPFVGILFGWQQLNRHLNVQISLRCGVERTVLLMSTHFVWVNWS